ASQLGNFIQTPASIGFVVNFLKCHQICFGGENDVSNPFQIDFAIHPPAMMNIIAHHPHSRSLLVEVLISHHCRSEPEADQHSEEAGPPSPLQNSESRIAGPDQQIQHVYLNGLKSR